MANTTQLTFTDIDGYPLPAGVNVSINGTATGWTTTGGILACNLVASLACTAAFTGSLAPSVTAAFMTSGSANQTVSVPNYCSPFASQLGYADRQAQKWPRGWFGDPARAVGGGAYTVAQGAGAELYDVSAQIQADILNARLQTSTGTNVDAWATDYFGASLPRNAGETDAAYIARIEALLSAKLGTRVGILAVANAYGTAWINEPWLASETGAYDTPGTLAYDTIGGYGSQQPLIQVFVQPSGIASNAQLKAAMVAARACGLNIQVVSITSSPFILGTSTLGVGSMGGYAGTLL